MCDKLIKAFSLVRHEPERDLPKKIWVAVVTREQRLTRLKLWIFSSVGLVSLIGLVPTFRMLFSDFAKSGLYDYLSLAFSDSRLVLSYWREFSFSVAESLPIISIISSLAIIFIFFLSIKYIMKQIMKSQSVLLF